MPNGKVHLKISLITGATLLTSATLGLQDVNLIIGTAGGTLWASLITPDLDVDNGNITIAKIRQHLGRPAAGIYRAITYPYAKMAKHRGASHTPILGTFWRIIYFYCIISLLIIAWEFMAHGASSFKGYEDFLPIWPWTDEESVKIYVAFFCSACIIDLAHIIADWSTTAFKRWQRRQGRRQSHHRITQNTPEVRRYRTMLVK